MANPDHRPDAIDAPLYNGFPVMLVPAGTPILGAGPSHTYLVVTDTSVFLVNNRAYMTQRTWDRLQAYRAVHGADPLDPVTYNSTIF